MQVLRAIAAAVQRGESVPEIAAKVVRGAMRGATRVPEVRGGIAGAALGVSLGDAANLARAGDLPGALRHIATGAATAARIAEGTDE